jgi:hypothetical protein
LTRNADGKGDGLKDITIFWDDSYAARYGSLTGATAHYGMSATAAATR